MVDLFLEHNNSVHIILFTFFFKFSIGLKKDMGESVQKNRTLECKSWPRRQKLYEGFNLRPRRLKWCDLSTNLI